MCCVRRYARIVPTPCALQLANFHAVILCYQREVYSMVSLVGKTCEHEYVSSSTILSHLMDDHDMMGTKPDTVASNTLLTLSRLLSTA